MDEMTGLYNGGISWIWPTCFAHTQRLGQPLVALMIDVDHFKQINDMYAMPPVIRCSPTWPGPARAGAAGRYRRPLRRDEFIIIIPGTPACERLSSRPADRTADPGEQQRWRPVSFTVSIGVANLRHRRSGGLLAARSRHVRGQTSRGACWRIFDGTRAAIRR